MPTAAVTPRLVPPPSRRYLARVPHRALALLLSALHAAYALFVVLGGLLVLRWPSLLWLHLIALLWAIATLCLDLGCPLTQWEKALSRRGGIEPYPEGFLQHYLDRADRTPAQARRFHLALGAAVLVLNGVAYVFITALR